MATPATPDACGRAAPRARQVAALTAQARRRAFRGQARSSRTHEVADGAFGGNARIAGGTAVQVVFDERPLGDGQFAVDVRRDERID